MNLKIWALNMALLVVIIFLGLKVVETLGGGMPAVNVSGKRQPTVSDSRTEQIRAIQTNLAPKSEYSVVVKKNVFSPERKLYIPEEKPENKESESPSDNPQPTTKEEIKLELYGVTIGGDTRKAMVSNPVREKGAPAYLWVQAGDRLENLKITEVHQDKIIYEDASRKVHQVSLYDEKEGTPFAGRERQSPPNRGPTIVETESPESGSGGKALSGQSSQAEELSKRRRSGADSDSADSEGEYRIINTPFGEIRRKVE